MDFSDLRFLTERLEIRRFVPGDFAAFHAYHSQPEVYRYLYAEPLDDAAAAEKFQRASAPRLREDDDAAVFAVERREDGAVIGEVVLKLASAIARQVEVGYIFNPVFAGKGYATEAMRAVLDFAFSRLNFHRLCPARCRECRLGRGCRTAGHAARGPSDPERPVQRHLGRRIHLCAAQGRMDGAAKGLKARQRRKNSAAKQIAAGQGARGYAGRLATIM